MSFQQVGPVITLPAGADLSASWACAVDVDSSGEAVLPSAGGPIVGVLTDKATAGQAAAIQVSGIAQMKLGGTVAKGDQVKVDTSGRAVAASASDVANGASIGRCILGGAVNNIGAILLTNFGQGLVVSGGALETVSANGAISVVKQTTLLSVSGTKAYTLASGLYPGQRKWIQCSVAASIPSGVVTGVFLDTDGTTSRTTATFDGVADQLILEWTGAAWQVLTKTSVTMG